MELSVTFTLSDKLFALLEDKLPNLGRRVERAITKEIGAQTRRESNITIEVNAGAPATAQPQPEESKKPGRTRKPKDDTPAVSVEVTSAAETEAPAPQPEAPAELTYEDCRAALHRLRVRFEGEGYENKTGEGYDRYHKQISGIVKQIVCQLSGGKAAKIPELAPKLRAAFIAECDGITADEKGELIPPRAPF